MSADVFAKLMAFISDFVAKIVAFFKTLLGIADEASSLLAE